MIVGALNFLGYLDAIAAYLFGQIDPAVANILIGLSSAFIDNGTLMFAVLNMHPEFTMGQWLLLTLTLGVGGSLLAIGSVPGLHVLGLMRRVMLKKTRAISLPCICAGCRWYCWASSRASVCCICKTAGRSDFFRGERLWG